MKTINQFINESSNTWSLDKDDEKIKELYTECYIRSSFKDKDEINSFLDKK